ncbi:MAG: peptidylprolyl isomerase [Patescibacteria group bacterium]
MKSVHKKALIIAVASILVIIGFIIIFTYVFYIDSPAMNSTRKALRLPAITVDGHSISLTELEENTSSIKRFYENQDFSQYGIRIDFNTDDGKNRLKLQERKMINKLIEDITIEQIAREKGLTLSDEAVKAAMERPMDEMGTKEKVESTLDNLYGWSLEDFGQKVVRTQLLREKVEESFVKENSVTEEMRNTINTAKQELDDNRDFVDVAQKYSEGITADKGGIMGWFADGELQDAIGKKIFTLNSGDYTDVIETPLGLHIVKVDQVSEVEGKKFVHVSQIVVKRKVFADYLNDEIKKKKVKVFLPQYKWDANSAMVVFEDEALKEFEEKIKNDAIQARELLENEEK